jgi:hypothetical protein
MSMHSFLAEATGDQVSAGFQQSFAAAAYLFAAACFILSLPYETTASGRGRV